MTEIGLALSILGRSPFSFGWPLESPPCYISEIDFCLLPSSYVSLVALLEESFFSADYLIAELKLSKSLLFKLRASTLMPAEKYKVKWDYLIK